MRKQPAGTEGVWLDTADGSHRHDADGTIWSIRPDGAAFVLSCTYRDHRVASRHDTPDKAKAHRDDLVRSWEARRLADYQQHRSTPGDR